MQTAPKITCIRSADWIAAWDGKAGRHVYLRNGDVAFQGDRIVHVGGRYEGPVATEIDGRRRFVMPGLINVHNHPANMPSFRGVREELGNVNFYQSGLYDGRTAFAADDVDRPWNALLAFTEMLRSGVTTYVDMSFPYPGWIDAVAKSGLRAYLAPLYESQHWHVPNAYTLTYRPEADRGRRAFADAMAVIDAAEAHPSGRMMGMVAPMAIDTCDADLLVDSLAEARRRQRPIQLHAGEAVMEFLEMTRRHGKTQVQWLKEIGFLAEGVTIGHGLFLGHHSWLSWDFREDIDILAEAGVSVAHCPTPFSRYGITMESFGGYVRAGINMGIGTDTHPHNMIEEMRTAIIMSRVTERRISGGRTLDVFNAATIGGARILHRDDLGRLAPGAKADIVLIATDDNWMLPVYDPLRCLVFTAADRAVRDVFVDGTKVLDGGRVVGFDAMEAAQNVQRMQDYGARRAAERDHSGRRAEEIAPTTLPMG
ncbi:MAG: amidohydrolase family protein [Alphaproteobacteria bacterium]|nr:amidohydrolase family protein [Alphaproteobacteria bacterium]